MQLSSKEKVLLLLDKFSSHKGVNIIEYINIIKIVMLLAILLVSGNI